jgi:hypothetical protein
MRRLAWTVALTVVLAAVPPVSSGQIDAEPAAWPAQDRGVPFVMFVLENDAARGAAEQCRETWEERGLELAAGLLPAGTATDTIHCLVIGTEAFQANFSGSLPDWGVGVAVPTGRAIALDYTRMPAVGRGVREVFLHEMVHALLFQACPDAWLPTWFHEGAAMLYSGEWKFHDTVSLALDGRVPRLERLTGRFPRAAAGADRAYRTSLLAVNRLRSQQGENIVLRLVEATGRTGNFDSAFFEVTGQTVESFGLDFDRAMNLRYGWLVMMTRWPGLFVLTGLIFAAGAVRKIIHTRRRMAEMVDEIE